MQALNIPNTLTATRIILIPIFVTSLEYEKYDYALYIFAFAALSDLLDGLFARLRNQKTQLGTVMDPLADKFMLVTAYVFFAFQGWIPPWLTIMVISRDVIIVTGCVLLYLINHTLRIKPTVPGKLSTIVQFALIWFVLLNINFGFIPGLKGIFTWATAVMTGVSGLHYIYKGFKLTGEH